MKILYVVNGIRGCGGLERVLAQKASYFAENYGCSVRILVLNEPPGELFFPINSTVEISYFHATGSALTYLASYRRGIRSAVEDYQPDIISICDDGLKGFLVPWLLPRLRPVLIYERHASIRLMRSEWKRRIMRYLARGFDSFVVLTNGNRAEWAGVETSVIANAIPEFESALETPRLKQVLCVGSINRNKGHDLLVSAWAMIANNHTDWSLQIYGRGDAEPFLELARSLGIDSRLAFHPPVANIAEKYREASMFVLPSRSEGFGMVLLEAMACGLPCISFDCPSGPRDILTTGVDGILVPAEDMAALANAIECLIVDPERRKTLAEEGMRTACRYDIAEIGAQWHTLFTSLLARNN